jgi:DNA (cytosine-5)-methyltransferase 1
MNRIDAESETLIAHALRREGFDASEDGTGRGTPLVPVANSLNGNSGRMQIEATYLPILEVGARTGVSTTDIRAGSGIGESADPMFTLQARKKLNSFLKPFIKIKN